jgi:hypothetical protein
MSYVTDQLRALEYVHTTLRPARALASVNMSLGGGQYIAACDLDSRKAAIDNLRNAGIATIVAAGNNNFRNALTAPACISTAIAVGGVTDTDNPPADSVVLNIHNLVDLLAPAYSITSSYVGGGYASMSGTSYGQMRTQVRQAAHLSWSTSATTPPALRAGFARIAAALPAAAYAWLIASSMLFG